MDSGPGLSYPLVRNIWLLPLLVLSKRENFALLSLYTFEESVFIFNFHNYAQQNVILNFIIQKFAICQTKHNCLRGDKKQIFRTIVAKSNMLLPAIKVLPVKRPVKVCQDSQPKYPVLN